MRSPSTLSRSRLALEGGDPVRTEPWPRWPHWTQEEHRSLAIALESGIWGLGGEMIPHFERLFSELHGARFAVGCCNGTMALQAALMAAGVCPGDEVITTPYSFVATATAPLSLGARVVFADIEADSYNLDPASVEDAISSRTRAILPVHLGGRPADLDGLRVVAEGHGVPIVEDAAQAVLASWNGKAVGTHGIAGVFSFQSSKNLTAGEGGAVLTNDPKIHARVAEWQNCGRARARTRHQFNAPGLNLRLTEFQAAVLLAGLKRLPAQQERRSQALVALSEGLSALDGARVPAPDPRITGHGCHFLPIRLIQATSPGQRDWVVSALRAEGIPVHPGYTTPLHQVPFLSPTGTTPELPVAELSCQQTVWLKQEALLAGTAAMKDVVQAFRKVLPHLPAT